MGSKALVISNMRAIIKRPAKAADDGLSCGLADLCWASHWSGSGIVALPPGDELAQPERPLRAAGCGPGRDAAANCGQGRYLIRPDASQSRTELKHWGLRLVETSFQSGNGHTERIL